MDSNRKWQREEKNGWEEQPFAYGRCILHTALETQARAQTERPSDNQSEQNSCCPSCLKRKSKYGEIGE